MASVQETMDTSNDDVHNLDQNNAKKNDEEGNQKDCANSSPTVKRASRAFEEEYIQWENKINKEFVDFLAHIRDFVTQKEGQLKEYQIDLCHRERSLQTNEDYFKDRMATLKKAEEEFQQKVERLNLQIQDRMQRLRAYEGQKNRFSASYSDAATQTDLTDSDVTLRMHTTAQTNRYQHSNGPTRTEGDYMFMGATEHSPEIHYTESPQAAHAQSPDEPVTVDTAPVNDSGFNTPDPDEVSPAYNYETNVIENSPSNAAKHQQLRAQNINGDMLNVNSAGSRTSTSSLGYTGERAILVKSPNGVEAYTTRAHEYRGTVTTRSRSVPPEEQKPRNRSLSPSSNRSQSMPAEPDNIKSFGGVHVTLSDNFIDRPASFAEGQRSPESQRGRAGSFGTRSVNGHMSRRAALHAKKQAASKPLQRNNRFTNNPQSIDSNHTRSLSLGNEPINNEPKEDELPNSVPDYIPQREPSKEPGPFGSSSVTNLDDPRLRESILSKSKQASSFNMNDAIARYKAKSENHLHQEMSLSDKDVSPSNGTPNWDSDSGFGYKARSYNQNQAPSSQVTSSAETSTLDVGLPARSRIPGRRSEPFDFRQRNAKLTSYTHSDSNILNGVAEDLKVEEDINRNNLIARNEYDVTKTRVTSPKPILKNPLKQPYTESYHNTYQTTNTAVSYSPTRLQPPSTKTYRRYEAPPPIRRYPSDGDANKDRVSIKSSTSDLAHHTHHHSNAFQQDSSSSHGSNTGHINARNTSESPEMTSTPRDLLENVDTNLHTVSENDRGEYKVKSTASTDYVASQEYKPMRTFGGGGQSRSNTGSSGTQIPYRESTLQHPLMAGKISLRDKSTWAIKKRRELNKPTDLPNNGERETTLDRTSRRLVPPGTYQRAANKESRPKSAHLSSRSRNMSYEPEVAHNPSQALPRPVYNNVHAPRDSSPATRRRDANSYTNRRSHSSEGYLEGRSNANQYIDKPMTEHGYKSALGPPPYNQSKAPPSYKSHRQSHDDTVNNIVQTAPSQSPSHYFNNEVLERCSDSDSELYTSKKETKKKSSIKSKLKGLYNKSNTAKAKSADHNDKKSPSVTQSKSAKSNNFGYQGGTVSRENAGNKREPAYSNYMQPK